MTDILTTARNLRPSLAWGIDDEGNVYCDDGDLTTTIYSFGGGACKAITQIGCFVIATSRAETIREALEELEQEVAQKAGDPDSIIAALRRLKEVMR